MATAAHCFYCFECLSASFEGREPAALEKIVDLWEQYEDSQVVNSTPKKAVPSSDTQEELVADSDSQADEEEHGAEEAGDEEDDEDDEDDEEEQEATSGPIHSPRPELPSISRLREPTGSSRSSNSSTPSTLSASSSNSALTTASSATSISISISSTGSRPSYASRLSVTASYPLFVTWNTISRSSGHKSLRGCIGTFDPLPLSTGLATYALTSAFDDTRFSPVPASLLPSLSCSLTLLANFEPCTGALDWILGTHGLRISFSYRNRRHSATYLPDVAVEQGWSKEETVESLMRKAGWDGGSSHHSSSSGNGPGAYARRILRGSSSSAKVAADDAAAAAAASLPPKPWDEVHDFRAVRYTGLKASAGYTEWKVWRGWVERSHGTTVLR